jgi:hypothetical protein
MSVTKRINGNYTITTAPDPLGNITLTTNTVFINGNLQVGGTSTSVDKIEMTVMDNIIVLNKGEAGSGVTLGVAGIEIDRGLSANVQLIYNDTPGINQWQITNDGTVYANILSSSTGLGINIVDDTSPQLGGDLDVLSRVIFSSTTDKVKIDSNLALVIDSVTPSAISNYNTIYAAAPAAGGSGVYQTSLAASDELVSRNRALVFSLVL